LIKDDLKNGKAKERLIQNPLEGVFYEEVSGIYKNGIKISD